MHRVEKQLLEHEFNDLMNNWLDPQTRGEIERAARRRTALEQPEHSALAAEHALRRYRPTRWLIPLFVLQLGLALSGVLLRHQRSGWDAAWVASTALLVLLAAWQAVTYYRAFTFHASSGDLERLRALARERRARA